MRWGVSSLLIALAFMFAGNSLQLMIVLARAEMEGFIPFQVALLTCFYFAGFMLGCRVLPKFLHSFGHIRLFSAMASLASASIIAYLLWIHPYFWIFLRLVSGFCIAGMLLTAESWLASVSSGIESFKLFSIYRTIDICATVLGLLLVKIAPIGEYDLFAFSSVALSVSLVPISLTFTKAPTMEPKPLGPLSETLKLSKQAFAGCLLAGLAVGAFWGLAPTEAMYLTGSAKNAAFLLICYLTGGFLTQICISLLSKSVSYQQMITALSATSCIFALFGCLLDAQVPSYLVYACSFAFGAMSIPIYSVCVAHANEKAELTDDIDFVASSSNLLLTFGVGAALGPALAAILQVYYDRGMFQLCFVVFAILALVCLRNKDIKPPIVEQSDFIPINVNTVSPEMDPRI